MNSIHRFVKRHRQVNTAVVLTLGLIVAGPAALMFNNMQQQAAYASEGAPPTSGPDNPGSCMPLDVANAIFEDYADQPLGQRINSAIVAFNSYTAEDPSVRIYSDTANDYRAWRDGQLPQEATVIVWTDLAGTVPEVITEANRLSPHTLDTDFRAVTNYIQGGWGFFVVYGPVMMRSPFGGAIMCGQFDGTQPTNAGTSAEQPQPPNQTGNPPSTGDCMTVLKAKAIVRNHPSIDKTIDAFNAWVKNNESAGVYGDPGTIAWPKDTSIMKEGATVIVWTDLQNKRPRVLTPADNLSQHTLNDDFRAVKGHVQGTWGLFVAYGPVEMPSGFGAVILCGQYDGTNPVSFGSASAIALAVFEPTASQCMSVKTAKRLVFGASSIDNAINRLNSWNDKHPNAALYGGPGTIVRGPRLVWTNTFGHNPKVLSGVWKAIRVDGGYGVFEATRRVKMGTGFGSVALCGRL